MSPSRKKLLLAVSAAIFATGVALGIIGLVGMAPGSGEPDQSTPLQASHTSGQTASGREAWIWELRHSFEATPPAETTPTAATAATPAAAPTEVPSRPVVIESSAPPARVIIEAIGVNAPMITLGLDSASIPEVPSTGAEVGWYNYSGRPGSGSNVVISGHVTWDKRAAVFWRLGELQEGELIRLTTEGGDQLVYQVTANLLVDPSDPESVRLIYPTDTEMLTLVTCGGTFNRDASARFGGQYTHRTVVQAKPVS